MNTKMFFDKDGNETKEENAKYTIFSDGCGSWCWKDLENKGINKSYNDSTTTKNKLLYHIHSGKVEELREKCKKLLWDKLEELYPTEVDRNKHEVLGQYVYYNIREKDFKRRSYLSSSPGTGMVGISIEGSGVMRSRTLQPHKKTGHFDIEKAAKIIYEVGRGRLIDNQRREEQQSNYNKNKRILSELAKDLGISYYNCLSFLGASITATKDGFKIENVNEKMLNDFIDFLCEGNCH